MRTFTCEQNIESELNSDTIKLLNYLNDNGANIEIRSELYANQVEELASIRYGLTEQRITINIRERELDIFDLHKVLTDITSKIDESVDERYKYTFALVALKLSNEDKHQQLYSAVKFLHEDEAISALDELIESGELSEYYELPEMNKYKQNCNVQHKIVTQRQRFIKELLDNYAV